MFNWFKKDKPSPVPNTPEAIGLRLGGAFELDDLKLKLIESELVFENASRTHLIEAVGEVKLDEQTRLLRFYTDDEGYIQVLQHGKDDAGVSEVKLFYFYGTSGIDTDEQWDQCLNIDLVQPKYPLEGHDYSKVWDNVKPVAMTETTWINVDGKITSSSTDQFIMLYEREVNDTTYEYLLLSAEEKIIDNRHAERCVVTSTGIDLSPTDFKLIG